MLVCHGANLSVELGAAAAAGAVSDEGAELRAARLPNIGRIVVAGPGKPVRKAPTPATATSTGSGTAGRAAVVCTNRAFHFHVVRCRR